jgi:hypothetical protein
VELIHPLTISQANRLMTLRLQEEARWFRTCPIPPCPERGDLLFLTVHVRVAHPEPEP